MNNLIVMTLALASLPTMTSAQEMGFAAPAYCSELKRVTALAMTRERFAAIAGKAREGNFRETDLALTGWSDCSLYGPATYTCDSQPLATAEDAETAQASTLQGIRACLGEAWAEASDRSSSRYVILHHAGSPLSLTLSTDQTEKNQHLVRLVLFVRRN